MLAQRVGAIEERIRRGDLPPDAARPGTLCEESHAQAYVEMVAGRAAFGRRLKMVVDAGNGMGGRKFPLVARRLDLDVVPLFFELDGTFPNHEANPLNHATLETPRERVVREGADLGVAFDGDADRSCFVDERDGVVTSDLATAARLSAAASATAS